ncbi:hypothetical protein A3A79_01440 [Candidatus Gottesmanbacteria bacterium RIFCSPLOWO2_01_FULL_43_11b]|uniref:Intein C-terminal splicing domain-containing protein n=1 Tax=Candidatus Gottesmanbacteria bacterium RIFCSPLOWO2_01_FULL_43_11b TaxID=1798392 RepID=A0A1F6AGG7_9BACT|nr:MAG: hypothetical protein A3A79_01440 [Candidatus Gottesmanbacteria bacterium RIFCSPLOWO2_01_FULL_43_11b]
MKVGDTVVSQSEDGKQSVSTVTKLDQPVRDHMCQINFSDGDTLKLTSEHPLLTQDGWKAIDPTQTYKENPDLVVSTLEKGDRVSTSDGNSAEVASLACWSERIQTYNLILDDGVNTYFADGYLAHNKDPDPEPPPPTCSCPAGYHAGDVRDTDCKGRRFSSQGCNAQQNALCGSVGGKPCALWGQQGRCGCGLDCDENDDCVYACNDTWEIANCVPDATPTPTPNPVTILSRGMVVSLSDTTCPTVRASSEGADGTVHQFLSGSASQPAPQTQSGTTYVQFNNLIQGDYTIDPVPPANYSLVRACWSQEPGGSQGEGVSRTLAGVDTLTWDLGFILSPWGQVQGGDVYGTTSVLSLLPQSASPRLFNLDGDGGDPGVVTYGNSYDFAAESTGADPQGADLVSSKNWLVNETHATINWYDTFFRRFGSPTVPDYDCTIAPCAITQPPSRATAYFVSGDMTTSGSWSVGTGDSLVFLVDGNLTIDDSIRITGRGFVGFVVSGNITVSGSVGSAAANVTPNIEGVFITSPTGSFSTGQSTNPGQEKLVVKGTIVAGTITLQRDLGDGNTTNPAELFIYNPLLLVTMPEAMKETKIAWQEVAP